MRTALTVAAILLLSIGAWTWAVAELSGPHSTAPTATTADPLRWPAPAPGP